MKKEKLDKNQLKVVDFVAHGIGNLIVNAYAGSGKTTTIVKSLEVVPKDEKVLFVAFNKHIVLALKNRIEERENCMISTYHSLGMKIMSAYTGKDVVIDDYKYDKHIMSDVDFLSDGYSVMLSPSKRKRYIKNVKKLSLLSRYNLAQNERQIKKIAEEYDVRIIYNEPKAVERILEWGQDALDTLDYTDLVWIPAEKNIIIPYLLFDMIFIDEAQDTSPCQQKLFQLCMKSNSRCIMVGDNNQCINAWCGSDKKAFETLSKLQNTKKIGLSVSYRCSKKVIGMAKKWVTDIEAAPGAIEGDAGGFYHIDDIRPGDMVLCRTNEPLLRAYMMFLRKGIKCYIIGNQLKREIIDTIRGTDEKTLSPGLEGPGVIPYLYYEFFEYVKEECQKRSEYFDEVLKEKDVRSVFEWIKSLEVLAEGLDSPEELYKRVRNAFIDEADAANCGHDKKEYVSLTSIHRGKGLESDYVYMICPSLIPSKYAKTAEEIESEQNLYYVAVTRAKKGFRYVYESDVPTLDKMEGSPASIKEIKKIMERVEAIYGKIMVDESELSFPEEEHDEETVTEIPKIPEHKNKKVKFTKFL